MIASGEHSFPSEPRRVCRRGVNHCFDFIECLARNAQLVDHPSICWTDVEGTRCATHIFRGRVGSRIGLPVYCDVSLKVSVL